MPYGDLPAPQLAFNRKVSLIYNPAPNSGVIGPACNWSRTEIVKFLTDVVDNQADYCYDIKRQPELALMRDQIVSLSAPDASNFNPMPLKPKQHIYRKLNPPKAESHFSVRNFPHDGLNYFSPHDLLGKFLSTMDSPPNAATWDNYYFPLLYVYGRWCARLASREAVYGVGDPPYMVSCAYVDEPGASKFYQMGASLSGYNWNVQQTGDWKTNLQLARYNVLDATSIQAPYNFDFSPRIDVDGADGTRFGNCSETYPLSFLSRSAKHMYYASGVALRRSGYMGSYNADTQDSSWSACANCKYLIKRFGGFRGEFEARYRWNK